MMSAAGAAAGNVKGTQSVSTERRENCLRASRAGAGVFLEHHGSRVLGPLRAHQHRARRPQQAEARAMGPAWPGGAAPIRS